MHVHIHVTAPLAGVERMVRGGMNVHIHVTAPLAGVERMVRENVCPPFISALPGSRAAGAGPGEGGDGIGRNVLTVASTPASGMAGSYEKNVPRVFVA